jgi:hypothetical protein
VNGIILILKASINYETAWSPATAFYLHISKLYPCLKFKQKYADEGGGFLGYNMIYKGEIIEDVDYEWRSEEGILLREDLGCYSDEEDEEDEEDENQ